MIIKPKPYKYQPLHAAVTVVGSSIFKGFHTNVSSGHKIVNYSAGEPTTEIVITKDVKVAKVQPYYSKPIHDLIFRGIPFHCWVGVHCEELTAVEITGLETDGNKLFFRTISPFAASWHQVLLDHQGETIIDISDLDSETGFILLMRVEE